MEVSNYIKKLIYNSFRRGNPFSLIQLILKIHQVASFYQTTQRLISEHLLQKKIDHSDPERNGSAKANHIKNLKEVQFELRPFFDGTDPTEEKIQEFIDQFNRFFCNRSIDQEGDLVRSIRQRKLEMIHQGEKHYIKDLGIKIGFYGHYDPMIQKIQTYAHDRFAMASDFGYQQVMLDHFRKWYVEITLPPSLPPSAADYIASSYRTNPERDA